MNDRFQDELGEQAPTYEKALELRERNENSLKRALSRESGSPETTSSPSTR